VHTRICGQHTKEELRRPAFTHESNSSGNADTPLDVGQGPFGYRHAATSKATDLVMTPLPMADGLRFLDNRSVLGLDI